VSVQERVDAIRARIAASGRDLQEVAIVAVTKGYGLDVCHEAVSCGLNILGENRVQEALPKMAALAVAEWHLIGHLQTNKVKLAVGRFRLIQSVDSIALAHAIAKRDPTQAVLLEVNVARESQKHGIQPEHAVEVAAAVAALVDLRGLMAMGPLTGDPKPAFAELKELRDLAEQRLGRSLPVLSMGMSGDYEVALEAGSTMLRLGRALFGNKNQ
jgi:PLP dependent protein